MGFFDEMFSGKEHTVHPDPYGLGAKTAKFYGQNRRLQFKLYAKQYKQDRAALQRQIDRVKGRFDKLEGSRLVGDQALKEHRFESGRQAKAFNLGAANRGFYSTTVPGAQSGQAASQAYGRMLTHFEGKRQSDLDRLRDQMAALQAGQGAMAGQFTRGKAGLYASMPKGYQQMLKMRGLMGARPYTQTTAGEWGGVSGPFLQAAGTAIGVGAAALI